jgi:hypothetical protein
VEQIPQGYLKKARKMKDEQVLSIAKIQFPQLSDDDRKRILDEIRKI